MPSISRKPALLIASYVILAFICVKWISHGRSAYVAKLADMDRLTQYKSDLESILARKSEIDEAHQGLTRLTGNHEQFFATDDARSKILFILSGLGRQSGMNVKSIEPRPEIASTFFSKWPVTITVEGSYAGLVDFLARIEQADSMMGVIAVDVHRPAQSQDRLTAMVSLLAFLRDGQTS